MTNDNSRLSRWVAAGTVFLLMAMACHPAVAQQVPAAKTLVVVGSSPGGGNVSAARDKAIQDALVTAVAIMAAEILQPEVLVENFPRLEGILFSQPTRYVKGYKVLAEAAGDQYYRVVAQVNVSGREISNRLKETGIIQVNVDLPSVLFAVAEQTIENLQPQFWWDDGDAGYRSISDDELAAAFRQQGFTVIDYRQTRPSSGLENFPARVDLTDREAAELGARYGAEVVVVGAASAELANVMGSGLRSYKGGFAGRAVRVSDAAEIATVDRTALVTHTDDIEGGRDALAKAVQVAGTELAKDLAVAWKKQALTPATVEVVVEGTSNLVNFVQFRRALSQVAGVEGIQVKEMRPDEAVLTVGYRGKARELASALMLESFESFGIRIDDIRDNFFKVRLISG